MLPASASSTQPKHWDLPPAGSSGYCLSLTHLLALQEHKQAQSDGISPFLGSEKSKFFQNVDCFHLILDEFAHQYSQYLEYIDNSSTLTQKIWSLAAARLMTI